MVVAPNVCAFLSSITNTSLKQTWCAFNRTFPKTTGSDAIDWLISWSFAEDRQNAVELASEMLQYGFFNPIHMDIKENVYEKIRDSLLVREMVDSQDAYYDYVSAAVNYG